MSYFKRIPELFNPREFRLQFDEKLYQQAQTSHSHKKFLLIRYNFPEQLSFFGLHVSEDSTVPPYQVKISRINTGGLSFSCTCAQSQVYKRKCIHMISLGMCVLEGHISREKRAARLGLSIPTTFPGDKSKIINWLHQYLSIIPAATPISQLTWFNQRKNFSSTALTNEFKNLSHLNLGQALLVLQPVQPPTPTNSFIGALEDQLDIEANEWLDHRLYEEDSKQWRKLPKSPIEQALWQAAYQIINRPTKIEDIATNGYITHEFSWGCLQVSHPSHIATPPQLQIKSLEIDSKEKEESFDPLDINGNPCLHKYSPEKQRLYAGIILDQLFHPAFSVDERKRLFDAYQQQPWERSIAQLMKQPVFNSTQNTVAEDLEQNTPELIGFQIKKNNQKQLEINLCALKPYQRREGFKVRFLENSDIPPKSLTPQEMAVYLFSLSSSKQEHQLLCALELLISSPYVVNPQGESIVVKRSYPQLYLGPIQQGEIEELKQNAQNQLEQDFINDFFSRDQKEEEGESKTVSDTEEISPEGFIGSLEDDLQMLLSSAKSIQSRFESVDHVFNQSEDYIDLNLESSDAQNTNEEEDQSAKKRRGRPPKNKGEVEAVSHVETILSQDAILPSMQKKRGRPPKNKPVIQMPNVAPVQSEEVYAVQFLVDHYVCQNQSLITAPLKNEFLCAYFPPDKLEICVFRLPQILFPTIKHFLEQPLELPARESNNVSPLIEKLETYLPIRLPNSLKGQQVEPDLRPLIRCTPSNQSGNSDFLTLQIWSRPLQQGPIYPPGEGPAEIAIHHQGLRIYTKRPIHNEVAYFEQSIKALPLTNEIEPYKYEINTLQEVLDLIDTLQNLNNQFQVEWGKTPYKIRSNALSTSKLKVQIIHKRNWLNLEVDGVWEHESGHLTLKQVLDVVKQGHKFIEIAPGEYAKISDFARKQLDPLANLLPDDKEIDEKNPAPQIKLMPLAALQVMYSLETLGAKVESASKILELQVKAKNAATTTIVPPSGLNATLRAYQLSGFEWLARTALWSPGVCLADDMGLGKTLQALTLLLYRSSQGPSLIVSPASVAQNWIREAAKFTPTLNIREYRGADRKFNQSLGANDAIVTSYSILGRDIDFLESIKFATVIYDEAQALKNPESTRAKAAIRIKADYSVALSGTPIENHLSDLWSLARIVTPGLLASESKFRDNYIKPISYGGETAQRAKNSLTSLIRPFVLRRLKKDVAPELPARIEKVEYIDLSEEERQKYENVRRTAIDASKKEEGKDRFFLLASLTRLRQLACAISLVYPENKSQSTKITRLVDMMLEIRENGGKTLVFSQFTQLLELVREKLQQAHFSLCYLDGSTPVAQRQKEVDFFQEGKADAFLISLKAGGTGLNLTKATYVFHLDPWWNPAAEDQATDRAHRIGQTEPVTVYRLVSNNTIEEQVLSLHKEKKQLAEALIGDARLAQSLSQEQLVSLLRGDSI